MTAKFTILFLAALTLCASPVLAQNKQYTKALNTYGRGSYVAARDHLQQIERPDAPSRILLAKVLYQLADYEQIGKVLTGLMRQIDRTPHATNVEDEASLQKTKNHFAESTSKPE